MNKTLSICIPTYNRKKYLKELLDSILQYTESMGIYVCVSDNCSPDGTGNYLKELALKRKFFSFQIQPENIGLEKNMISVISMANTDYYLPIGDDEVISPEFFSLIDKKLDGNLDLLILDGWHVNSTLEVKINRHLPNFLHNKKYNDPFEAFTHIWDKMPLGSFVVKTECNKCDMNTYLGTSHIYTSIVWEYLSKQLMKNKKIEIECISEPVVLFRQIEKTWRSDSAQIMLYEIPQWFLTLPKEYKNVTKNILDVYLSNQAKFRYLLYYRSLGQLDNDFINTYMTSFKKSHKNRAYIMALIPPYVAKILVNIKTFLARIIKK